MPQANGFSGGGYNSYTNYTAMQQDALRRVNRMERRAQQAVNGAYVNTPVKGNGTNAESFHTGMPAHNPHHTVPTSGTSDNYRPNENQSPRIEREEPVPEKSDFINTPAIKQGSVKSASGERDPLKALTGLLSGDTGEQLFLILLIYILIREKSDPCLIAALIYLLL